MTNRTELLAIALIASAGALCSVSIAWPADLAVGQTKTLSYQSGLRKRDNRQSDHRIVAAYEWTLNALQAERRKLKAGKSTGYEVWRLASDLRGADLLMSSNMNQRIAALARHVAAMRDLEEEVVRQVELGALPAEHTNAIHQGRITAEADLLSARNERN